MGGGKEKKKMADRYCQSDERSAKKAETKAFPIKSPTKHILSKKLFAQR
jgi:hypothetical protein